MSAIRKFNAYCEQLEALHDPMWSIPLPTPLPTKLDDLRNHQLLMEDIWISPAIGEIPRWVEDQDVRDGIRAMLKRDRCLEEQRRLGVEADNLCRWYGNKLAAVELALRIPESGCPILAYYIQLITFQMKYFISPSVSVAMTYCPCTRIGQIHLPQFLDSIAKSGKLLRWLKVYREVTLVSHFSGLIPQLSKLPKKLPKKKMWI